MPKKSNPKKPTEPELRSALALAKTLTLALRPDLSARSLRVELTETPLQWVAKVWRGTPAAALYERRGASRKAALKALNTTLLNQLTRTTARALKALAKGRTALGPVLLRTHTWALETGWRDLTRARRSKAKTAKGAKARP